MLPDGTAGYLDTLVDRQRQQTIQQLLQQQRQEQMFALLMHQQLLMQLSPAAIGSTQTHEEQVRQPPSSIGDLHNFLANQHQVFPGFPSPPAGAAHLPPDSVQSQAAPDPSSIATSQQSEELAMLARMLGGGPSLLYQHQERDQLQQPVQMPRLNPSASAYHRSLLLQFNQGGAGQQPP